MAAPAAELETARLLLRPLRADDCVPLYEHLMSSAAVTRYLGWRTHQALRETREYISHAILRESRHAAWTRVLQYQGQPQGLIQIEHRPHGLHLGFLLAEAMRGQGLMPEALAAIMRECFGKSLCERIDAVCDVENLASARVMEKSGMQREGCLRRYIVHPNIAASPRDVFIYARLAGRSARPLQEK